MKYKWIVNEPLDLILMWVGIITFLGMTFFAKLNASYFAFISIFLLVLLDSGHVFLTYIRIYKEYKYIKKLVIYLHIGIFLFFFLYQFFEIPYLWHLVVYSTLFHFMRQFYGISRWYMFIDKQQKVILDLFYYSLILIPLIALHFRTDLKFIGYYNNNDVFKYPNETLFLTFAYIHIAVIILWLGYELYLYLKDKEKYNFVRFIYFLTTAILFALVSYLSNNALEIILPIIVAHGLQYYILNSKVLIDYHYKSLVKVIVITLIVGGVFGYLNSWAEEVLDMNDSYLYNEDYLNMILVSLLLTPLFGHYILDMIMWKKDYFQKYLDKKAV